MPVVSLHTAGCIISCGMLLMSIIMLIAGSIISKYGTKCDMNFERVSTMSTMGVVGISLAVVVLAYCSYQMYVDKKTVEYTTDDFTVTMMIVKNNPNDWVKVEYKDKYGRPQDCEFEIPLYILKVGDSNELRYEIRGDADMTCRMLSLVITEDVAEEIGYPSPKVVSVIDGEGDM